MQHDLVHLEVSRKDLRGVEGLSQPQHPVHFEVVGAWNRAQLRVFPWGNVQGAIKKGMSRGGMSAIQVFAKTG